MQNRALVIGDIHGMFLSFEQMLNHWHPDQEDLILIGDYIDRGPQSDRVLKHLLLLQEGYPDKIKYLRGNHEQLLLNFLYNPSRNWGVYHRNGGDTTLAQLLKFSPEQLLAQDAKSLADQLIAQESWLLDWLESLPYYYSYGRHIIVHAGVNLHKKDWRHTSLEDYLWIREEFHQNPNLTGRNIIFGHTPVIKLHDSFEPWISDDKWGIDGGKVFGGSLIGLRIDLEKVHEVLIE